MATAKKGLGSTGRSGNVGEAPSRAMVEPEILERIVRIVGDAGLTLLDWRRGDERLVLRRGPEFVGHDGLLASAHAPPPAAHVPAPRPLEDVASSSTPASAAPRPAASGTLVTSPFVGTFYRASSPDAPVFVEAGQVVRKGQVLCIIEAMKLMNEIEAELAGKITEVVAQNGQTVEFGQALFRIEPT